MLVLTLLHGFSLTNCKFVDVLETRTFKEGGGVMDGQLQQRRRVAVETSHFDIVTLNVCVLCTPDFVAVTLRPMCFLF